MKKQYLNYVCLKKFAETNKKRILKCSYIKCFISESVYKDWDNWVKLTFEYKQ